jgi:hypothetical protein
MAGLLFFLIASSAQELDRVHVDAATGEITLAARNSKLREHAKAPKWDVITDMVVLQGRLLASTTFDFGGQWELSPWAYSKGAQVLEYSPGKDQWTVLRDFESSMFLNIRVVGDRLMIPEFFPLEERSRLVHTFDGRDWETLGLLPQQNWHVMDVTRFRDRLYVSGSWRDLDPEAAKKDPNWWPGYGRVFESADEGKTWAEIRRTRENGRVLDMVEYQGRLFACERGIQLIAWDGKSWEEIPVRFEKEKVEPKLGNGGLMVFAGKILAINADLYYTFDGKRWLSHTPGYIALWRDGAKLYGLRDDGNVNVTEDAVKWTRVTNEGVPAKEFDRQAPKGRPLHRGSLALYRGRLFVGTGAEGRIYAAPIEDKGSFSSKPVKFDGGDKLALSWETAGAGVRLQFRTAERAEDLAKALWKPANKSPLTIALPKKQSWAQYRVELESDGKAIPLLKSATLARE